MMSVNIRDPAAIEARVHAGKTVNVTTRDGRSTRFVVKHIDSNTVSSDSQRFAFGDIERMEVKAFDANKVIVIVALLILVPFMLYLSGVPAGGP